MKEIVDIVNSSSREQKWVFEVESNSMAPSIKEEEKVEIRNVEDFSFGDVLVFRHGEELLVHRIIWQSQDTYYTKGDAVSNSIEYVEKNMIAGKVISVKKGNKKYSEGKILSTLRGLKSLVKYGLYRILQSG